MTARRSTATSESTRRFRCFSNVKRVDSDETWDALRARIARTPSDAMVRGMFLSELLRSVPNAKIGTRRYIPFSLYPVREYMDLILQVAATRHIGQSPATSVLRAGSRVYSVFATSLSGIAIFSIAHVDFRRVIELSPKAYGVTLKPGNVEIVKLTDGEAFVRMRSVWPYPDFFHAGIWLGAMEAFGIQGEIEVTRHSPCDVDFQVQWAPVAKDSP